MKTRHLIQLNLRPIGLIILCGCIGYFCGNATTGVVAGLTIVAIATLFL